MIRVFCLCLIILLLLFAPSALASPVSFGTVDTDCRSLRYITQTRPQPKDIPLQLYVGVYVFDIAEINETAKTANIDFLLQLKWKDARLANEVQKQSFNYCLEKLEHIWHPHPDILNARELKKKFEDLVYINTEGIVTYSQFFQGKINSSFNFKKFPFDRQIISIKIIFFDDQLDKILLVNDDKTTGINNNLFLSNWSLYSVTNKIDVEYMKSSNFAFNRFDYNISVKRSPGFPIWKMIFPISLITFMAYLVFWLHPTLIVPQITLSVVSIINIIAFQSNLSTQIPRISYLTGADKFIVGSMLMIFLALVQTVITLNLSESGKTSLALSLDWWMRLIYPIIFVAVMIFAFVV